ncbi:hypothetical protein [Helicobacter sp. MIT 99-10781]|uniref:hypothetical protein n=1 Tax=Helicobacter sp. MIT 99-10781 TaxID=1332285 RepID=UPI0011C0660C|nr:hypothetical protein [Helicobacter sp. MIT 99-10781]
MQKETFKNLSGIKLNKKNLINKIFIKEFGIQNKILKNYLEFSRIFKQSQKVYNGFSKVILLESAKNQ